jgi:hypothetical protein
MPIARESNSETPAMSRRVRARVTPVLRVGYVEAKPGSYRAHAGSMRLDAAAIHYVADAIGARVEFTRRTVCELSSGLLTGDYDIAIGGLSPSEGIECIAVSHSRGGLATNDMQWKCRQAFFPNMWWIRRGDRLWSLRLRLILFAWKFDMHVLPRILRRFAHTQVSIAQRDSARD